MISFTNIACEHAVEGTCRSQTRLAEGSWLQLLSARGPGRRDGVKNTVLKTLTSIKIADIACACVYLVLCCDLHAKTCWVQGSWHHLLSARTPDYIILFPFLVISNQDDKML
jgi:hypothetical protein